MKLVAPVSRATGVSIEKTSALLGILANNGLKGGMAGTGLATTFIELNKKGITLEEGMRRINESQEPLKESMKLVGKVAGKTFLTLAGGVDKIDGLTKSLEDAKGTADEMAKIQLDNVSGDMKILGSAFEGFLLSVDKGDGFISKISRSFVQLGTSILGFLTPTKAATDAIRDQQKELFILEGKLNNANTSEEERRKIIVKLKEEYPDYLKHLDTETATNKELSDAISKVNDNLVNKIILARKDKEIQEQAENVADETISKLEREDKLRTIIANNRIKYGFQATEGTLLEQAEAQRLLVKEEAVNMSISDKQKAYRGLRDGVTLLTKATESLNKEQGKQDDMLSEQDALYNELGIKRVKATEEETEVVKGGTVATQSLIAAQEAILDIAKKMPETTEAEIVAKNKAIQVIEKEIKRLKELGKVKAKDPKEQKKLDSEAARLEKELQDFNANTKEEARELEKDKLRTNFEELLEQLGENEEAKIELTKSYLERMTALKKKHSDEDLADQAKIDKKKLDETEALADAELGVQNAKIDAIGAGFSILGQLAEENKGLQAVSLIGENAAGIAKQIINTQAANAVAAPLLSNPTTAAAGAAAIARNKIALGIGIASSVAATAKGLSALGQGGAPSGGAEGGAGGAQAPSFNLVEGTESNAIQNTITGQGNTPVKAYVTSGDITTAQQADRQAELNSGF